MADTGLFNDIIVMLGGERASLLQIPSLYMPIYVLSGIWKEIGWSTIIYLAALSAVDEQLYEAARLDGAGRLKQAIHVTIPGIMPTLVIRFIMNVGTIMSVGYEKSLLLYNDSVMEVADIISTYMYRMGIGGAIKMYGLSAAVDLFNALCNVMLVVLANKISRKTTESSLW
jgi:putative aldouronate transport system permease protein